MSSRSAGFSFSLLCFLSLAAVRPSFAVPSESPSAGESVGSASTAELLAVAAEMDPQCLDSGKYSSDDLFAAESCTTASEPVAQVDSEPADPKGKTSVGLWALGALALIGGVVAVASGGGSGGSSDDGSGDDSDDLLQQIYDPAEFETGEYKAAALGARSGLEMINASYRYSFGASGDGVLVSVLDTGIDADHIEFHGDGKISDQSKSYLVDSISGNEISPLEDYRGHGTFVAALIAANKDGRGMHGVAYEADLLILQGIEPPLGVTYVDDLDVLADAWDTSHLNGAVVMNNSWGIHFYLDIFSSEDQYKSFLGDRFVTALQEANTAGMITVFAAGNEIYSEVHAYAAAPYFLKELQNTWLAVVATDYNNNIANFSNYCGAAMNFCISAPGHSLYSAQADLNDPSSSYTVGSGTSLSAPLVSGSVALLKHQFPSMGGAEIVQLIKDTATDLGDPGVDAVYGHGLLNLGEAMSPQGTMMVAVGSDVRTAAAAPLNQTHIAPTGPVGAALAGTLGDKQVAALDDFARPYYIPLSALSINSGSGFGKSWNAQADYLLALGQGSDRIKAPTPSGSAVLSHAIRPCLGSSSLNQAYLLAHGGDCSSSVVWIGDTSLSLSLSGLSDQQFQGVYSAFDVGVPFAAGVLELGFGVLDERESLLGSPLSGGFAIDGHGQTAFLRSGYRRPIASDWLGFVNLAVGETSYGSSGILSDAELTTWSWSAGLHTTDLLRSDDVLALSVKTPLAVSSGHVDYELPSGRTPSTDGRQTYGLTTTRIREELGSEDVVPLDLAVSYGMDLGNWDVNVGLMARTAELQVDDYIVNLNMGFSF